MSVAVLEAIGTVLTNKYSEGYPGRRYYEGQQFIDPIETIARDRAKALFGVDHANVQPYSGSPANLAVYLAFLQPGDTVMGMALPMGGHLTHGWPVSATGKWFHSVQYGVRADTGLLDLDEARDLARRERPKLIFCGGTAIPRTIDFPAFAEIAREVGAILVADIAHIAGLIAGGAHPSPVGYAPVITTTTHKTLRGPARCDDHVHRRARVGAGQGGVPWSAGRPAQPHHGRHRGRPARGGPPSFRTYAAQVVANSKTLADALLERGYDLMSGGTDNHLILIDLTSKGIAGKPAAKALDRAGIELNYNTPAVRPAQAVRPVRRRARNPGHHHRRPARRSTCRRSRRGWTRRSPRPPRTTRPPSSGPRARSATCWRLPDARLPGRNPINRAHLTPAPATGPAHSPVCGGRRLYLSDTEITVIPQKNAVAAIIRRPHACRDWPVVRPRGRGGTH